MLSGAKHPYGLIHSATWGFFIPLRSIQNDNG